MEKIFVDDPEEVVIDGKSLRVVQDYEAIKDAMDKGETVVHWEGGQSLFPLIKDMEYCKITPIHDIKDVHVGDCVFCKINGYVYMVHRVTNKAENPFDGQWLQIGNTWGEIYGWTQDIYGIATSTNVFQVRHRSLRFKFLNKKSGK